MPKARISLVFKGPANPSRRISYPPRGTEPAPPPPTKNLSQKNKSTLKDATLVQRDTNLLRRETEEEEGVSEKKKGKRKAVEPPPLVVEEEGSARIKVHHFECTVPQSTVDKTWQELSKGSKLEVSNLVAKPAAQSVSNAGSQELVEEYRKIFVKNLETLLVPPFPSTLKPRASSSKETTSTTIDLISQEVVKKKIESTRTSLEKEEHLNRELEKELESLKRKPVRNGEEDDLDNSEGEEERDEAEEEDEIFVLPVKKKKKKKKAVTIESDPVASTSNANSIPKPTTSKSKSKGLTTSTASKPTPPALALTRKPEPTAATAKKSILKLPKPIPRSELQGSDDFDHFVLPTAVSSSSKSKSNLEKKKKYKKALEVPRGDLL